MLSLFPNLFSFPLFAYFVLRILLAYQFSLIASSRYKKQYSFIAIFEFTTIAMLALGLYTQGALLATMVLLILESLIDRKVGVFDRKDAQLRTTLGLIAFSLMFLGAGAFAFDLPL
ncbi:MAG: hypothetical protein ACYCZW_02590 [Minisyncoccota bacterium]